MPTLTERKEAKEREDYIVELIKESGTKGVTKTVIDKDCNLTPAYGSVVMNRILRKHPRIKRLGEHNQSPSYVWVEETIDIPKETHSAFLKNRYEKTNRNSEGYVDMTAKTAIENTEPEKKPYTPNLNLICPEPGDIWVDKDGIKYYILSYCISGEYALCIPLFSLNSYGDWSNIRHDIRIKYANETLIGDLGCIACKYRKIFTRKIMRCPVETLMRARKELAVIFGIKPIWTEKAEEVKETPAPQVTKIPDGYISREEAEREKELACAAIWKEVAMKLLDSRN